MTDILAVLREVAQPRTWLEAASLALFIAAIAVICPMAK